MVCVWASREMIRDICLFICLFVGYLKKMDETSVEDAVGSVHI